MAKGKSRGTPDELDYLFERDIIQEEDYVEFWSEYWKRGSRGREELINDFLDIANQGEKANEVLTGIVTRNKAQAKRQAVILGGNVVRRNARGQFSKRGTYYQAVRKAPKKKK